MITAASCNGGSRSRSFSVASEPENIAHALPRVLYITTGIDTEKEDKDLPQAVTVALQYFNSRGVPVHLSPRDILYDYDRLKRYNILIINTAEGIHDADRPYSLTYMTEEELHNLEKYVRNGGMLIAGDNTGRNRFDGTDRMLETGRLDTTNYPLARVFGCVLAEKSVEGFRIVATDKNIAFDSLPRIRENWWTPVAEAFLDDSVHVAARWTNDSIAYPALLMHRYGEGKAWLLPTAGWLVPVSDGGLWETDRIERLLEWILTDFRSYSGVRFSLSPWPGGKQAALVVSFNPGGTVAQYRRITEALGKRKVKPVFFVSGRAEDSIRRLLEKGGAELASSGYAYMNYEEADYAEAVNDILRNENVWQRDFRGFRFPYTSPSFEGWMALDRHDYRYVSGIGVNNMEFLHGSTVPYNLVLSGKGFYTDTHLFEMSPTWHDDYFYMHRAEENPEVESLLDKPVALWEQYLQDYWHAVAEPYKGLMVYLGHPAYTGYSELSMRPLLRLLDTVEARGGWITTMDRALAYRRFVDAARITVHKFGNRYRLHVDVPQDMQAGELAVEVPFKPVDAKMNEGKIRTARQKGHYWLIFDARNGTEVLFGEQRTIF